MRPNDMPRPFAPEHSEGAAMGNLIEDRLRIACRTWERFGVANILAEAADELDRLRAEVDRLTVCLSVANSQTEDYERRFYLAQDSAETAERERDELRRRIGKMLIPDRQVVLGREHHGGGLAARGRLDAEEEK